MLLSDEIKIARVYTPQERAVVFPGDCLKLLSSRPRRKTLGNPKRNGTRLRNMWKDSAPSFTSASAH